MKKTIIALVGASGSGKTALSMRLKKKGYPVICSYTTRPMREGEIYGVDHIFATDKDVPPIENTLAYTFFGGYHYWASKNQVDDYIPTIYVIDEKGLIDLRSKYKDEYNITCVYITRPYNDVDKERQDRDNGRVSLNDNDIDLRICNNYNDVETFVETESDRIIDYIKNKTFKTE